MANKGAVTFDLEARVVGYEASLAQMKKSFEKIDIGSDIGQKLSKSIKEADAQLTVLKKNLTMRATTDTQIDAIVDKTNKAGESIQKVANLMQQVTPGDIDFSSFENKIKSLEPQLTALQDQLENKISGGLRDVISNSNELSASFKDLQIDFKDKSAGEIFQILSTKAEEAASKTTAAAEKLEQAQAQLATDQSQLDNLKASPLSDSKALKTDLEHMIQDYNDAFTQVKDLFSVDLVSKIVKDDKDLANQVLNQFFAGLTPENFSTKLKELKDQLVQGSQGIYSATDIYHMLFGNDITANNAPAITNQLLGPLRKIKESFKAKLTEASPDLPTKQVGEAFQFLSQGDLQAAYNQLEKTIDQYAAKIQGKIVQVRQKIIEDTANVNVAKTDLNEATKSETAISSLTTSLQSQVKELQAENKDLQDQINALRREIEETRQAETKTVNNTGTTENINTEQYKITAAEAQKYHEALDQIHAKEQLVGKIEGVVQRWFSIYAAVNMVKNAINSVISTLQDLDKTITEIAIVTDMTQQDLWGQMSTYTEMARQYASSISGVYKVSQLYYQQGLQTADVMALTEQTLKMARISGLDYADATNYMTNAVRSFKLEMTEAQRVVDVYSAVAAASATDTTELAKAMSKTASSAEAVGSSFENTTAMMAVMIEATRESAENIGSAMKSIISRYGEMTADPTKLTDSEGQEMSLNRVDKALQTVGISIHDAAGQFRNFDDVIMELAGAWDSIDKNTQRYIATIMAGNRQQSRFLALVSSYDRLKELSATATESEDAAQLQFLKTLDSIDAKTQQLKTSMQALYVDSGLENFYKGVLDLGNNVIKTFTEMPKIFNLPILAISKFGTQFYTLASVIVNVFSMIKMRLSKNENELTLLLKAAKGDQLSAVEEEAVQEILVEKNKQQAILNEQKKGQEALLASQKQGDQAQLAEAQNAAEQQRKAAQAAYDRRQKMTKVGLLTSAVGLITSGVAANVDINTNRGLKAGLTGSSAILQGAGTFLTTGSPILAALTALPGIIEAVGMASESTTERVKRLTDSLEEASNQKITSQDELKTLNDYKKKYEELYKARNNSNEAYQAYVDLSNEIAAKYPTLISGMDAENNYIVDLTNNYDSLLKAKQAAYNDDFIKAGVAQIQAYSDNDYLLQLLGVEQVGTYDPNGSINSLFDFTKIAGAMSHYFSELSADEWSSKGLEEILPAAWRSSNSADRSGGAWWNDVVGDIVANNGFGFVLGTKQGTQNYLNERGLDQEYGLTDNYSMETLDSIIQDVLAYAGQMMDEGETLAEINEFFQQYFGENFNLNEDLMGDLAQLKATADLRDNYVNQIIESLNIAGTQNAINELELDADTLQANWIKDQVQKEWENSKEYQKAQSGEMELNAAWKTFMLGINDIVQAASDTFNLYSGLDENQVNQIRDIYNNINNYAQDDISTLLPFADPDLIEYLKQYATKSGENMRNRFLEGMSSISVDFTDKANEYAQAFGVDYLNNILTSLNAILNNNLLDDVSKQLQTDAIIGIYDQIEQLKPDERQKALNIINNGDLTSLTGIYTIIEDLQNIGIDDSSLITALQELSKIINVNLATELEGFTQSVIKQVEDFDKALSNATKGMSLKEASDMASKLDISLEDFRFENGKYFFDDVQALKEGYLSINNELQAALIDQVNTLSNFSSKTILNSLAGNADTDWLQDTLDERQKYIEEIYSTDEETAKILVDNYDRYIEAWKTSDSDLSLSDYIIQEINKAQEDLEVATDYYNYQTNALLIQTGQITNFLKSFKDENGEQKFDEDQILTLISQLETGDFSNLPEELQQYSTILWNIYHDAEKATYEAAIKSLTDGTQAVQVTAGNKALLKYLTGNKDLQIGESAFIDNSMKDIEDLRNLILSEISLSPETKRSLLASLEQAEHELDTSDVLKDVVDSYEDLSYEAATRLARMLGSDTLEDYLATDKSFISKDKFGKYIVDYDQLRSRILFDLSLTTKERNELLSELESHKRELDTDSILANIIQNRDKLQEEDIASLATILNTDYVNALKYVHENADGSYNLDLSSINNLLAAHKDLLSDEIQTLIANEIDSILGNLDSIASTQTQGTSKVEDIVKQTQNLNQTLDKTYRIQDLYEYNENLRAFVYTNEGMLASIRALTLELDTLTDEEKAVAEQLIQNTVKQFADAIDVFSYIESGYGSGERDRASADLEKAINDYNQAVQATAKNNEKVILLNSQAILSALRRGGEAGVEAAQQIAALQGKTLTAQEIESAYRGQVARFVDAIDTIAATPGAIVDKTTADIINTFQTGGRAVQIGNTGQYVVESAVNLYEAYSKLLEELEDTGEATLADLNKVAGLALDNRDSEQNIIDALGDAAGMTYSHFGEILTSAGYRLTETLVDELEDQGIIKGLGGNQMMITDFSAFADLMEWEADSEQYTSAFKTYNDSLVDMNRKAERNIVEEVQSLKDAKPGDLINITQLVSTLSDEAYTTLQNVLLEQGAVLEDGLLFLGAGANIPEIIKQLAETAQTNGGLLANEMAELADTLDEVLKSYVEIIQKGISGTLTNVEASGLKDMAAGFGITDISFTTTAEGLKLSQESAYALYQELLKVDEVRARLVFDDLVKSLQEADDAFKNISTTTAEIARLERALAQGPDNAALRERLDLAKEIQAVQSQNPDQFNFMDRKMPDQFNSPLNYWDSVGEAFKTINEAGSSGYMEVQDFYNIVNEMANLMQMSGNTISFMGIDFDGSAETTAKLIEQGMSALTNVDGSGTKISLSKLGTDLQIGAEDMEGGFKEGIKAMAHSQIELLDAEIQMLEAMVAMEKLGDIDVDNNGLQFWGEMFAAEDDLANGIRKGDQTQNMREATQQILEEAKTNKDLAAALNQTQIGAFTLRQLLEGNAETWEAAFGSAEAAEQAMNAILESIKNGNFVEGLGNMEEIARILSENSEADITLTSADGTVQYTVKDGRVYTIDWENSESVEKAAKYAEEHKEDVEGGVKGALEKWNKKPETLTIEEQVTVALAYELIEQKTSNGKWYFNGVPYATKEEAAAAALFAEETGADTVTSVSLNEETGEYEVQGTLTVQGETINIEPDENGERKFYYGGTPYNSREEAEKALWTKLYKDEYGADAKPTDEELDTFIRITENPHIETDVNDATNRKEIQDTLTKTKEEVEAMVNENNELVLPSGFKITVPEPQLAYDTLQETLSADPTIVASVSQGISQAFTLHGAEIAQAFADGLTKALTGNSSDVDMTQPAEGAATNLIDSFINTVTSKATEMTEPFTSALDAIKNLGSFDFSGLLAGFTSVEEVDTTAVDNLNTAWNNILTIVKTVALTIQRLTSQTFTVNVQQNNTGGENKETSSPKPAAPTQTTTTTVAEVNIPPIDTTPVANASSSFATAADEIGKSTATASQNIQNVSDKLAGITDKSTEVGNTAKAIDSLKDKKVSITGNISANMSARANIAVHVTGAATAQTELKASSPNISKTMTAVSGAGAKGNVTAMAKGSAFVKGQKNVLMGELGPELVVANDRYYTVGNNGAEFVDLPDDAIVFNHLQTKKLLGNKKVNGRGAPAVSEDAAVSFAHGNVDGIAMASASSALTALKQIRAMWQSMLDASARDLGSQAGRKGGGGGGGCFAAGTLIAMQNGYKNIEDILPGDIVLSYNELTGINEYSKVLQTMIHDVEEEIYTLYIEDEALVVTGIHRFFINRNGKTSWIPAVQLSIGDLVMFADGTWHEIYNIDIAINHLFVYNFEVSNNHNYYVGHRSILAHNKGGGGGGGGGGDDAEIPDPTSYLHDLDRWYDLLRQIEKWEQKINYEEEKRNNMRSGKQYSDSLKDELNYLQRQADATRDLAALQKDWYEIRRREFQASAYSNIFSYDENGLKQYTKGKNRGLDLLATINASDVNGKAKMTAQQQVEYILNNTDFELSDFEYDDSGNKIKLDESKYKKKKGKARQQAQQEANNDYYTALIEQFWNNIDSITEEMDSLYDSYNEKMQELEQIVSKETDIIQEYIDKHLEVEKVIYKSIEDREQAIIDALQDERDNLEKATTAYIEGLTDALDKERNKYEQNNKDTELVKLQRQLAILQRSGGSSTQIKSLQDQISSKLKDSYFDAQQNQIDSIQEASDKQLERMDTQIELMTEALEYQKENGLFWREVSEVMATGPNNIRDFIARYNTDYRGLSNLDYQEQMQELGKNVEIASESLGDLPAMLAYRDMVTGSDAVNHRVISLDDVRSAMKRNDEGGFTAGATEGVQAAIAASDNHYYEGRKNVLNAFSDSNKQTKLYADEADVLHEYDQIYAEQYEQMKANGDGSLGIAKMSENAADAASKIIQAKYNKAIAYKDLKEIPKTVTPSKKFSQKYIGAKKGAKATTFYKGSNYNLVGYEGENFKIQIGSGKKAKYYLIDKKNFDNGEQILNDWKFNDNQVSINKKALEDYQEVLKKYKYAYKEGGVVDYTGLAWVDGTKKKPESFLNAAETKFVKEQIFGKANNSLLSIVTGLQEVMNNRPTSVTNASDSISIGNIEITLQTGVISNDYSAQRAGDTIAQEILKIARKTGANTISRR